MDVFSSANYSEVRILKKVLFILFLLLSVRVFGNYPVYYRDPNVGPAYNSTGATVDEEGHLYSPDGHKVLTDEDSISLSHDSLTGLNDNPDYQHATTEQISHWNEAYGWGNHALQNYFDIDINALTDIKDVDVASPTINYVIKWNGTKWVAAAEGTSFAFSIASFNTGISSPQLIGSGTWKTTGAITFTASYNNGNPDASPYISLSSNGGVSWASNLTLSSPYSSVSSAENTSYPSNAGLYIRFTLNATQGTTNDTDSKTIYFYNYLYYGTTTKMSGYTESDVEGLTNSKLTNDNTQVWDSITAGASEYLLFAFPKRLGTVAFWVGGFEGGFESPETVSITNSAGFTEDYYVWRSTNSNLGSTIVETK